MTIDKFRRSTDKSGEHHAMLDKDEDVVWFEQQIEKKRRKRNSESSPPTDPLFK